MTELHNLKLNTKKVGKKRIGRGGKRGTYSGRGQKGQHSRAGRRIRPAERDILLKFPKLRGNRNAKKSPLALEIHVGRLQHFADADGNLTKAVLIKKGLIKRTNALVKVLSGGEPTRAFTIEGISVSKGAKAKIEAKGGSVKI